MAHSPSRATVKASTTPFMQNRNLPWQLYAVRPKRFGGDGGAIYSDFDSDDGDDELPYRPGFGEATEWAPDLPPILR